MNTRQYAEYQNFEDYRDNPVYFLIVATGKKTVDVYQHRDIWYFDPLTEIKVVHYNKIKRKDIRLVFYVPESSALWGIAKYEDLVYDYLLGNYGSIDWLYKSQIHESNISLRNPYTKNTLIFEAQGGAIIQQGIAEELCRFYEEIDIKTKRVSFNF